MRFIIIDIKSADEDSLAGKDLFTTDAPVDILNMATTYVAEREEGFTAEDEFIWFVERKGYKIEAVCSMCDIDIFVASNDNF